MAEQYPLYELTIDENNNEEFKEFQIALVDIPAIDENFYSFSKQTKSFCFSDEEKKELVGAAMIPNLPMYRNGDKENPEGYFVQFSADTIRTIAQNFAKNGLNNQMNLEHTNLNADSYVFQSFIIDENIKAPEKLGNLPLGSWIIGVKVEDSKTWNLIKDGTLKGFSIQGYFESELQKNKYNYKKIESKIDIVKNDSLIQKAKKLI